jgi:hypothetical protein
MRGCCSVDFDENNFFFTTFALILTKKMFVAHVPQGFSGRLDSRSEKVNVIGLFTYGISTCNILALISSKKCVLIHIDLFYASMPNRLEQELDQVGEEAHVVIIYKPGERFGDPVNACILSALEKKGFTNISVMRQAESWEDGCFFRSKIKK